MCGEWGQKVWAVYPGRQLVLAGEDTRWGQYILAASWKCGRPFRGVHDGSAWEGSKVCSGAAAALPGRSICTRQPTRAALLHELRAV